MKVNTMQVKVWRLKFKHGDLRLIAAATGLSYATVRNAITYGIASEITINKINKYERKKNTSEIS